MRLDIKNKWYLLFGIYTFFIIYGTTLPFNFTISDKIISNHANSILTAISKHDPLYRSYSYDLFANILFFMPFGFFLFNGMVNRLSEKKIIIIFIKITLFGLLLSAMVETVQIFTIDRNPSISDILMNTLGTVLGIIGGYLLLHFDLRKKLQRKIKYLIMDPDRLILITYLLFLLLAGLVPFDITIEPSKIIKNIKSLNSSQNLTVDAPRTLFNLIFIWGTAGYVISRYLRKSRDINNYFKQTAASITYGFVYVVFIEILQLFIITQNASIADIFIGWLGVLYGIAAYQYFHKDLFKKGNREAWHSYSENKNIFYFIMLNYIAFVFYKYAYPFSVETSGDVLITKLHFFFFNVNSYIPGPKIITLLKMSVKNMTLFLPAGMMLKEAEYKWPYLLSNSLTKLSLIALFVAYVKTVQFFNAVQLPYFFDLVGISLGTAAGYIFWKDFKSVLIRSEKKDNNYVRE